MNQTQHRHVDTNLTATAKLAAADAADDYTAGLDTRGGSDDQKVTAEQTFDYRGNAARENCEALIDVDATTTLVATKLMTFGLQDSDDNSSFAAIAGVGTQTVVGITGNGNAQTDLRWSLPSHTRRYIRAFNNNPADGGDNTADDFTLKLVT